MVALGAIAVVALALLFGASLWDRLDGSNDLRPVTILREGSASGDGATESFTIDVAAGETLVVDARAVALIRDDEFPGIDNTMDDGILLAAEGGHRYALTIEEGRWAVVADADGRQAFCNRKATRDDWGVEYTPSTWPDDPC